MKVAVIIDTWFPYIGGGQINAWEISKRLADKKTEIDIITRNNGKENLKYPKNVKVYKLGYQSKPDDNISKIVFLFLSFIFLINRDYDLIHVHPFLPAPVAKLLSVLKRVPVILTVHGTRLFEPEKKTPSRLLEKFILTGIKYDMQISVTQAFLKIPNVNKSIVVIPNGIDHRKFATMKISKFSKPTVLWVGRFDPVKRVEDLILATKYISKKIKNLQLVLVGYGYQEEKLKKLVRDSKLKNVKFLGFKTNNELITLYKKSHVFVLPSSSEGQPLTLLEAQAASLPVVATNVGGIPEVIKHNYNGLLVPSQKPQLIANAIIKVLQKKNNFGSTGLRDIKKKYSWIKTAKSTLETYLRVTKRRP